MIFDGYETPLSKYYKKIKINELNEKHFLRVKKTTFTTNKRDKVVLYIGFILTFCVLIKLISLVSFKTDFLLNKQEQLTVRKSVLTLPRGNILDRYGSLLASSTPLSSVYFNYNEFKNSDVSDKNIAEINDLLLKRNIKINILDLNKNKYLVRNIPPSKAEDFKNLNISGINIYNSYKRFYPLGEATFNLLGRTNVDDVGIDGIEYKYNNILSSQNGLKKTVNGLDGKIIGFDVLKEPKSGADLKLTIDSNIQVQVFKMLKEQVLLKNAKGGAAIVLNAKTGEILAMDSYPSVNPNPNVSLPKDYQKHEDPTYQSVFDPGSIMKPLVIAKALSDKKVKSNTVFSTTPLVIGSKKIVDDHPINQQSVKEIIQHSSDIGTAKIALMYQPKELYQYYQNIGFGKKTDIGLSGETRGILNNYKKWTKLDQALMSYGYGISITLLQIASSYSIFTNNGCYIKPKLFISGDKVINNCYQAIDKNIATTMNDILESTVNNGTGKNAKINNVKVAGKTGTAQKLVNGRYVNNSHIASFVGYAPVDNPKYIVAVMIDEPKNGYYASTTATPLFKNIMEYLLKININS